MTPTSARRHSLAAGVLYLLTFASIPTLGLYQAIQSADYLSSPAPDTGITVGVLLELIVALACIGTAVALYPIIRAQGESVALGFVGARVLEASTSFTGVATVMTLVTLHRSDLGADAATTGRALVALHEWLTLGQGLMPAINAVLLGSLLLRGRLVPRVIPTIGLIGAPLLLASTLGTLVGAWAQHSPIAGVAALPIALWEFSLGVWLVVRGVRPAAAA